MPTFRPLPARPSLEYTRKEAKAHGSATRRMGHSLPADGGAPTAQPYDHADTGRRQADSSLCESGERPRSPDPGLTIPVLAAQIAIGAAAPRVCTCHHVGSDIY